MKKITNPDYQLPEIFANEYIESIKGSANTPILVRGIDKSSYVKNEYVVKLKSVERMADPAASMRELLACFIAMEMEIPCVEPALIEITNEFVALLPDNTDVKMQVQKSLGYNFGSIYRDGYQVINFVNLNDKLNVICTKYFCV